MNRGELATILTLTAAAAVVLFSPRTEQTPLSLHAGGSSVTLTTVNALLFGLVYLTTVIFFTYHLGKRGEYPDVLYLLAVSTLVVWTINTPPKLPKELLESVNGVLLKLGLPLRLSQETALYSYVYLMLLLVTSNFYIAPKHSRELGFLAFGMTFSMPLFRVYLKPEGEIIGLTAFAITLALSSSLFSSQNPLIEGVEVILISISTAIAFSVRPIAALIPIALTLTFPRKTRNLIYLLLSTAGFLLVWMKDLWIKPYFPTLSIDGTILQSGLPVLLILYFLLSRPQWTKRILRSTRGPTPFLLSLTVVYSLGFIFDRTLFPYLLLLLASLSVRIIYQVRNMEKGTPESELPA